MIKKRSRGGLVLEARKLFIYASHKIFGFPVIEIARYSGISGPAASISLRGGEGIMKERGNGSLFLNLRPSSPPLVPTLLQFTSLRFESGMVTIINYRQIIIASDFTDNYIIYFCNYLATTTQK